MRSPFGTLRSGLATVREFPQLFLTIAVACAILVSFAYIADRFIGIARSAQDQLINVRVGSLQDGFAPLAALLYDEAPRVRMHMRRLIDLNPTITEFHIVERRDGKWTITNSADEKRIGESVLGMDTLLSLATGESTHSFTIEEVVGGVRFFRTFRAIVAEDGTPRGIAVTRQSLSEADRIISRSISSSIAILLVIVILLLALFFRHARIIDYTVLYRKLKEVDQLKDDFISMASHELRTPLTAIRGYAELLGDAIHGDDPKKADEHLQRIDTSALALENLISDMLDVSRIEQGRIALEMKTIDPNTILTEVCDALEEPARGKGLSLAREFSSGLHILADETRFRQIAMNLIGNAIKYTEHGEVKVRSYEDKGIIIRVVDTGIGMKSEDRDRLFEKFHRSGSEKVRSQTGTGLGLWITKQLVEAMNGRISVESIEGVGTHVIVTFPVAGGKA